MQRRVTPELLDHDLGTVREIQDSFEDLKEINHWFGGTPATVRLIRDAAQLTGLQDISLLDIGAGRGDVPLAAVNRLRLYGIALKVTLLDRCWTHLPGNGTPSVSADAMRLPFRDDAFDIVSCSLFAHHFDPEPLRALLTEALRVSRHAVVVNDLIRSRLHLWLVYLWYPRFRSRISYVDGLASVRAAYTIPEMKSVVETLGVRDVRFSKHPLYRMGVVIRK
jgi:ubiquinone/menaquinone biosynthesis C-methylase UbiE